MRPVEFPARGEVEVAADAQRPAITDHVLPGQTAIGVHRDVRPLHRDHPPLLRPGLSRVRVADEALPFLRSPGVGAAPQAVEQRVAAKALEPTQPGQHAEASGEGEVVGLVGPGAGAGLVWRHLLPAEPRRQRRRRQRGEQAAAGADVGVQRVARRSGQVGGAVPVEPDDPGAFRQHTGQVG